MQVVGVGVQFALAIVGWGGRVAFFAHRALVWLGVVSAMFSDGNMSTGEREDKENRWVLTAFGRLSLLTAYLPAYTDRVGFWTQDGDGIRWMGMAAFSVGCGVRMWPVYSAAAGGADACGGQAAAVAVRQRVRDQLRADAAADSGHLLGIKNLHADSTPIPPRTTQGRAIGGCRFRLRDLRLYTPIVVPGGAVNMRGQAHAAGGV